VLELSRPAAAKTGTTNDYRDAWTVGYTPDLVTGVWVGNSDNSPMIDLPGSAGAGPIWHSFMEAAHADLPVREFVRPPGIVEREVCADSGALPTEYCPRRQVEVFAEDQPPLDAEHDWYQMVKIDAPTGLLANEFCPDQVVEQLMIVITDQRGREWAQAHPEIFGGLPLAPLDTCTESTDRPQVFIIQPASGSVVHGIVPVVGTVRLPRFDRYEVQYGIGDNPQGWGWISGPHLAQVQDGLLTEWNTSGLSPGPYTLRVTAFDREQHRFEGRVHVFVTAPAATPTPSPPPTLSPSAVPSPTLVPTAEPTEMPTVAPTAVVTDTPTLEPSATLTPTLAPEPTEVSAEETTSTPDPSSTPEEGSISETPLASTP
jgi:membrane peptidoglycan carboxypeptidase